MFREAPQSNKVSWTLHKGSDFPDSIESDINEWQTSCNIVDTPERLTTRGWNQYGEDEKRGELAPSLRSTCANSSSIQVHNAKAADRPAPAD